MKLSYRVPGGPEVEDNDSEKVFKEARKLSLVGEYGDAIHVTKGDQKKFTAFGLCSSCTLLQYVRTEFSVLRARCADFRIDLHENNPVLECTGYEERGQLTLQLMVSMATMIDAPKNTQKIGFNRRTAD